jgi:hypothetical protein
MAPEARSPGRRMAVRRCRPIVLLCGRHGGSNTNAPGVDYLTCATEFLSYGAGMPRKPNTKRPPPGSYQSFTALLAQMERLIQVEDVRWQSSLTAEVRQRLSRIHRALRRGPDDHGGLVPRSKA